MWIKTLSIYSWNTKETTNQPASQKVRHIYSLSINQSNNQPNQSNFLFTFLSKVSCSLKMYSLIPRHFRNYIGINIYFMLIFSLTFEVYKQNFERNNSINHYAFIYNFLLLFTFGEPSILNLQKNLKKSFGIVVIFKLKPLLSFCIEINNDCY